MHHRVKNTAWCAMRHRKCDVMIANVCSNALRMSSLLWQRWAAICPLIMTQKESSCVARSGLHGGQDNDKEDVGEPRPNQRLAQCHLSLYSVPQRVVLCGKIRTTWCPGQWRGRCWWTTAKPAARVMFVQNIGPETFTAADKISLATSRINWLKITDVSGIVSVPCHQGR
jgi:hypothetical protein